tara:strand:- start:238 stop:381 length:144 start_codon:yes stop_codon:yes gene_type:complete
MKKISHLSHENQYLNIKDRTPNSTPFVIPNGKGLRGKCAEYEESEDA